MRKLPSMRTWLHRSLALAVGLGLAAGCKAGPVAGLSVSGPADAAAQSAPGAGAVQVTVKLPEEKGAGLIGEADRRIQSVNLARGTYANLYYAGAGIDGWAGGWQKPFPAAPDASGKRTVTFAQTGIPAGPRRVFRLELRDVNNQLLEEYWGMADIVVGGAAATLTLSRETTPTGKIFRKLLATKDVEKVLSLSVSGVQGFVDKLLNTDAATGLALDGTRPQINYSLLNIDRAASAIAVGQAGVPFTVPASVPAAMVPTPLRKAAMTIKAVDVKGQPITSECVVFINDQASPLKRSTDGQPVNLSFPDVTPGSWTATVVDVNSGRTGTGTFAIGEGQSNTVSVMMPVQKIDLVAGAYNLEAPYYSATTGYNGDNLHPLLTYLSSPGRMAMRNGVLYFVDGGNFRIRSLDLNTNDPVVKTIAGNGIDPSVVAPENAQATAVPIKVNNSATFLDFDDQGNLLFTEYALGRIAKVNLASGEIATYVHTSKITGWADNQYFGAIDFDPASKMLYIVGAYYQYLYGVNMGGTAPYPDPTASQRYTFASNNGSGVARAGDYLFYAQGNVLYRRNLTTNTSEVVCGKALTYQNGNGVPAQSFYTSNYHNLTVDALGNLYFTNGEVYRVTHATSGTDAANDWLVNKVGVSATGFVIDPTSGNFYTSGSFTMPDPSGSYTSVNVHAINVVRP